MIATAASATTRRRRRRWPLVIGLALAVVAVALGWWFYDAWSDEAAIAAAIAETDQLDPRWRFAHILADRPPIADAENSSLQVVKVMRAHGSPSFSIPETEYEEIQKLAPPAPLNANQRAALRTFLDKTQPALIEARRLHDMPRGRPQIAYSADFISTTLGPVQDARNVVGLLHCDVLMWTDLGNLDAAMDSCRAMLNSARSVGDEPSLVCVLIRAAGVHLTIDALERVLAQGEPKAAALAQMQAALAQEAAEPSLLIGLRGDRGGWDQLHQLMQEGRIAPAQVAASMGMRVSALDRVVQKVVPMRTQVDRAGFLRQMNELVEAAKLPIEEQPTAFERLNLEVLGHARFGGRHPWGEQAIAQFLRMQANLRCAITALAAERYRQSHGAWPATLDALVKDGLLAVVPRDPFHGQPLRSKQVDGGMVIYSIGPDRTDHDGTVDRHREPATGVDQGIRLWAVAARRP
jgi:hypothetical protein